MADETVTDGGFRQPKGFFGYAARSILILLAVISLCWAGDLPSYSGIALYTEQYLAVFLGLALTATFLLSPARAADRARVPWYDVLLSLCAIAGAAFVAVLYPTLASSLSETTPDRLIVGGIGLLLILEATRRMFGWVLVILAVVACLYAVFGDIFPGLLSSRAVSPERMIVSDT